MSWSYRVVKTEDWEYGIREIYWKESASELASNELTYEHIRFWTASNMYPYGETLEELIEDMQMMQHALWLPVLEESLMYKAIGK